jgi:hypothetical protein
MRCNGCDIELVDHLPPEPSQSEGVEEPEYVVIGIAQNPLEHSQIRSFLEGNGIPVEISGAFQILVPRHLEAAARELLAQAEHGDLQIEAERDPT